jgi:hypothetical protein
MPDKSSSSEWPSESDEHWLLAYGPGAESDGRRYFRPIGATDERNDDREGKWLLFLPVDEIDQLWETIKVAVEAGRLGPAAKVSPKPSYKPDERVVCVYTWDCTDRRDVARVLVELRSLGFMDMWLN